MSADTPHHSEINGRIEKLTQIGTVVGNVLLQADERILHELLDRTQAVRRKQWRRLAGFQFISLPGIREENQPNFFVLYLGYAAYHANPAESFQQFTALVQRTKVTNGDATPTDTYRFVSHAIEFVTTAARARERFLAENASRIEPAFKQGDVQALYDVEGESLPNLMAPFKTHSWRCDCDIPFGEDYFPIRVTVDRTAKRFRLEGLETKSLSLESFPGKLRTTSEVLQFVAATRTEHVFIEDVDSFWIAQPTTMKMYADLMDKRIIDLDRLRINVTDYEEWDYLNPEFDAEVERRRGNAIG